MIPLHDRNPTRRRAVVTILLIAVNVVVFVFVQPSTSDVEKNAEFTYERAAIPCELTTGRPLTVQEAVATANGQGDEQCGTFPDSPELYPHKILALSVLSSMFLHGGWVHLGGNMLFLWVFGNNVEDRLGRVRYLVFYLLAGLVATATYVLLQPHSTVPLIGASGAIAGVMGAYLIWYPDVPILTLVFVVPINIRARWLLIFWFLSQFFIGPDQGVAWGAHVGGFVFGVVAALLLRQDRRDTYRLAG
ncbi:MAG TPA: rhomboid family intramembrane serine protease [Acidimicrobiales bacterium]